MNLRTFWMISLFTLLLSACGGGAVKPTDKVALAESMVNSAREAEAAQYAPLELRLAEENLLKAKENMARKEYEEARRFAEKAAADAQIAEKTANAQRAAQLKGEIQDNVETLRRELDRK